jgi:hypothetical protein
MTSNLACSGLSRAAYAVCGLALAFLVTLPGDASAASITDATSVPADIRPPKPGDVLQLAHCCHAHPMPPYDAYCCHAPAAVVVPPAYGYYGGSAYYGAGGVVGQTRRVARRTSRRVGRRH